jgi:carboxylate-amine ligase
VPESPQDFSLGVEEEFQIIDPVSRTLRPRAASILANARDAHGEEVTNELYLSQIETGTPVCATLADARRELVRLRRELAAAAAKSGSRIAAAGTHPFSRWEDQPLTPKPRYRGLRDEFQQLIREQVIFGCHVHVGVADPEDAVRIMNRARSWVAVLIALAANSPFWKGVDTGYASYRTEVFGRFPTAGTPHPFASRAEFDGLIADLVATNLIEDGSKIYWDIRPSSHVPTLEFRAADVCATVDEAVMVAGLANGLARACLDADRRGDPADHARPELLQAAKWQAARYGLDGDLIDVGAARARPAAEVVESLLEFVRPALEEFGEWAGVAELTRRTLAEGNGATRQRRAYAKAKRFDDIVDLVVEETARDSA